MPHPLDRSSDPSRPGQIRGEKVLPERHRAVLTSLLPRTSTPAPAASLPLSCFDCWGVLTAPQKGRKKSGPVAWSPEPPFPIMDEKPRTLKKRGTSQKRETKLSPPPRAHTTTQRALWVSSPPLSSPHFLQLLWLSLSPLPLHPHASLSPFPSHLSQLLFLLEVRCQVAPGCLKRPVAEDNLEPRSCLRLSHLLSTGKLRQTLNYEVGQREISNPSLPRPRGLLTGPWTPEASCFKMPIQLLWRLALGQEVVLQMRKGEVQMHARAGALPPEPTASRPLHTHA